MTTAPIVGFAGTSAFGAGCLRRLHEQGVRVAAVLSQPDRPAGRRRAPTSPPVVALARRLGLPVLQPERADEALPALDAAGVSAMVLCAYGQLIPSAALDRLPWLNLHPSALPRWRGAAPIERSIMAGDERSAVAVIRLVPELDAGPVAAWADLSIGPDEDAGAVSEQALDLGVPLLARSLGALADGTLLLREQPPTGVTYAAKLTAADRLIDPAASRTVAHDRVRALSPHIGALLALGGDRLTVWRARRADDATLETGAVDATGGRLRVGFADGALELLTVQLPGRRPLAAGELLRGHRRPLSPATRADL